MKIFVCAFFFDFLCFFLFFCVHFLHFLLPPIVEVDISDIAIISGITNMVKAIILVINNTPQKTYRIAQYTDSWNRFHSLVTVKHLTPTSPKIESPAGSKPRVGNGKITGDRTSEVGTDGRACNNGGPPPGPCGQGSTQVQRRRVRTVLAMPGVECSPDLPRGLRRVSKSAPISRRRVSRHPTAQVQRHRAGAAVPPAGGARFCL
jgi:hypothetical protein